MLYISLILNLALVSAVGYLWLRNRDQKSDSERTAREFELMLQAEQADHRTELLQAHGLLMQAQQELREQKAGNDGGRAVPFQIEAAAD